MEPCDPHTIISLGEVVEYRIDAFSARSGWSVLVRHRHFGGYLTDCHPASFERLTFAEMEDVVSATVAGLEPR